MKFSIIDIETTGFSTRNDRIVELSVLVINENGKTLDSLNTLVSPERAMGATAVHGITSEMVLEAPKFREIALPLVKMIDDTQVVAHNAVFDVGFLKSELNRALNIEPNIIPLCTLQMARRLVPDLPGLKLPMLCDFFDIPIKNAHSAYHDCTATKDLFLQLMQLYEQQNGPRTFSDHLYRANEFSKIFHFFQHPIEKTKVLSREEAAVWTKKAKGRLHEIVQRLPDNIPQQAINVQEYVNILERALSDRIITSEESEALFNVADELGISRSQVAEIHQCYLSKLVRIYLLDGHLSQSEISDLENVATLLNLENKLEWVIGLEKSMLPQKQESKASDCTGKSVCFTGELCSNINGRPVTRELAHEIALSKGMVVKNGVSAKLHYLVMADPYSQSNKAKRARELNIPLLSEPMFWNLIGVRID
jgi:DNA polymerase-3 subunit epsilon